MVAVQTRGNARCFIRLQRDPMRSQISSRNPPTRSHEAGLRIFWMGLYRFVPARSPLREDPAVFRHA